MKSATRLTPSQLALGLVTTVLLLLLHLACGLAYFYPPSGALLGLALGSYLLRMWAITAGYHRYLAHRSFKTGRVFQFVLAFLGTSVMQNGPLWWASWHRAHHKHADTASDPHSPVVHGFWRAHMGWFLDSSHNIADLSNVKDLTRFPELRFLERRKWFPIGVYALGCYAIAGIPGLVWVFLIPTILAMHVTALINSMAHLWGSRRYETGDGSRNNAVLALLTLGEGWHNNHHYCMSSARQGFRWYEVDLCYYSLRILAALGIIWDLREPPKRSTL